MEQVIFFDPFADEGEAEFDAAASFELIAKRYARREIEHDYTADQFVADTKALLLDAQFTSRFAQMESIAARMHILCQDDHELQASFGSSESSAQTSHSGHTHEDAAGHAQATVHKANKASKKVKDKKMPAGLLQLILERYGRRAKSA